MAATTSLISQPEAASPPAIPTTVVSTGFIATGQTPWQKFANCQVTAQADGTATTFVAVVERTTQDPSANASPSAALVDSTNFTGNLATGLGVQYYLETGIAWWRMRITSISGGGAAANLSLSGQGINS